MSDPKKASDDDDDKEKAGADGEAGEGGEEGTEGKKKRSLKKILIIAVPLILLLGGGAGAYFMGYLDSLLGKAPTAEGEVGHEAAEGGGHGEKGGKGGHGAPAAHFVKIPDMVVNLSTAEGQQQRLLRLSIQLEVANETDGKALEALMPRLIDQFQTYLRELRPKDLRGSAGLYRLQLELLSRVNQAAAPIEVKDVLFQEILIN